MNSASLVPLLGIWVVAVFAFRAPHQRVAQVGIAACALAAVLSVGDRSALRITIVAIALALLIASEIVRRGHQEGATVE